MDFRTLCGIGVVALLAWIGYPTFGACYANGGGLISCGLVGFVAALMNATLWLVLFVLFALFNGVAHLFGGA